MIRREMNDVVSVMLVERRSERHGRNGVGRNRKSVAGTVSGFVASLAFCLLVVVMHGLPAAWIALALYIESVVR